jgi:hypothetical protein
VSTSTAKPEPTIVIDGYRCRIELDRYTTGQIDMRLILDTGEPFGHPSYPDPGTEIAPDEVIFKDYSEYAGYPEIFIRAGLAKATGRFSRTYGIPILKLLIAVPPVKGK